MGLFELGLVAAAGPHAVALLDLVGVGDRLAGQLAGRRVQADHLGPQPAAAIGPDAGLTGAAVEVGDEAAGVGDQARPGAASALARHPVGEGGWAVVGVDEAVDVTAEPQPQLEVAIDRRRAARSARHARLARRKVDGLRPRRRRRSPAS